AVELLQPAHGDGMDRHRIEEMQPLPSAPLREDQVGLLEYLDVLGDRLAADLLLLAELGQRLPVASPQPVEDQPTMLVGQGLEHEIAGLTAHRPRPMTPNATSPRRNATLLPSKRPQVG